MTWYRPPRHAPPWWPEGEAWPPRDARHRWRRRRARFVGRLALILSAVWIFASIGAVTVVSRVARHVRGEWMSGDGSAFVVFALLATMVAFVVILRRVGSPVSELVGAAHRIADGDFTTRVSQHGPPSVRVVSTAFNDMAERLAQQERQRRDLMSEIAHELRTPLSVVQGRLEGIIDGVYARDNAELQPLLDETRVLARLIDDLRTLANAESGVLTLQREPTDVTMLIHDAVTTARADAEADVTIDVDAADLPVVSLDPVRMRQVLVNLLTNAIRHGGSGKPVRVEARVDKQMLTIKVADAGKGIPAADLPRVFDRFYKGGDSRGSGLGLTIAKSLVRAHGGDIRAESAIGAGTTIVVTLPIESAAESR
ncbi:MAG TPA: ATP-binding protein [Vicinamibacterales bacterium]|jgi:signal transduction histidine kinase